MWQRPQAISRAPVPGFPRSGLFAARRVRELGPGVALFLLLWSGLPAPVGAQSRGDLQVAARVVETQPSQLALAQGLDAAIRAPAASTLQSLASIQVEPAAARTGRPAVARRPRGVVTISFLRN